MIDKEQQFSEQKRDMLIDIDRVSESRFFPPKVALKVLGFSAQNYRMIRENIDPEGLKRQNGFSYNALFVYFIFYALRERKLFSFSDIAKFDWEFIFHACELFDLIDIREMGIVYSPSEKEIWLVPKSIFSKVMGDDRFDGLKMEYVFKVYSNRLALEFQNVLTRKLTFEEQAQVLLSQSGFQDLVSTKPHKTPEPTSQMQFDQYFSDRIKMHKFS